MAALTPEQVAQLAYQAGFRGDALTTIVAIAKRESGYNPSAYNGNAGTGDNSVGLTQINLIGDLLPARGKILQQLGYNVDPNNAAQVRKALEDPLTNLKVAYVLSSSGTNFYPWGGYKGQDPTYATDIPAARTAVQNAGLDGGTGQHFTGSYGNSVQVGSDGGGTGSGAGGDTTLNGLMQLWRDTYLQEPQANDPKYANADPNDPSAPDYDIDYQSWLSKMKLLNDYIQAYESAMPSPGQEYQNQIDQFNAQMDAFNAKVGLDNAAQSRSANEINEFFSGKAEARARAEDQEKAQEFISQWGAPAGKTSFSRADLGMPLVNGVDQNAPFLTYSGQTYIDPNAAMAANDRALGVSGQMPSIPGLTVSASDIPTPPAYTPPSATDTGAATNWWQQPDSEGNSATDGASTPPGWHPPMAPPSAPTQTYNGQTYTPASPSTPGDYGLNFNYTIPTFQSSAAAVPGATPIPNVPVTGTPSAPTPIPNYMMGTPPQLQYLMGGLYG